MSTGKVQAGPNLGTGLPRVQGTVKWFSANLGYGFIEMPLTNGTKQADLFVHFKGIRGTGYVNLKDRQVVDFEIVAGLKGPQANDVVVLSDPDSPETVESESEEEAE